MKYKELSKNMIVIETDDGNKITISFAEENNTEVENFILESLVYSYEKRMTSRIKI